MASIYREGKYLYISYYVAGERKRPRKIATGIAWEGDVPTEESIKSLKSPEAKQLKAILAGIKNQRDTIRFARRFPELVAAQQKERAKNYTLHQLYEAYTQHKDDRRKPLSASSKSLYKHALKLLDGFRPGTTLTDLTKEFAKSFERHIYTTHLELSSLAAYVDKLKTLVNFAVTEEWIGSNPLRTISISVPDTDPVHDNAAEEYDYIRWAFKRKPDFALHYLYERLTGFRATDGTLLKRADVDRTKGVLKGWNQKLQRTEVWPIHTTLGMLLDLAELVYKDPVWVLPLRKYKTIYDQQQQIWEEWKMAKRGTHNWKRNYAADIEAAEPPDRISKLLTHHTQDDLERRYKGRPLPAMLKYSNLALDHFIPLLEELIATGMQPGFTVKRRKQRV